MRGMRTALLAAVYTLLLMAMVYELARWTARRETKRERDGAIFRRPDEFWRNGGGWDGA